MPHYQDVLNESFRWLDRDEHDVCEDVCPRWKATIGRMSNASLALRRIATVHLEMCPCCGVEDCRVRRSSESSVEEHYHRTVSLRKVNGGIHHATLETIIGLLRNSYVGSMRITCFDSEIDAMTLGLLRELQNCRVCKFVLQCPTATHGKQMLEAAHKNLRATAYSLHFEAEVFGTSVWKDMVFLDFVQRSNNLDLLMKLNKKKPFNLEWIDDLREMRDLEEVRFEVQGKDGRAESMFDRLIEAYLKGPSGFPRKLLLHTTSGTTMNQWTRSIRSGNAIEKHYWGGNSTVHFAHPSGTAQVTVARSEGELWAGFYRVRLYRGFVDGMTVYPNAAEYDDEQEYDENDVDYEDESDDTDEEQSDEEDSDEDFISYF